MQRVTEQYDKALAQAAENGGSALARAALREANVKLIAVERALTLNEGLPNRPWFKHQIYAPGFYTGYGVKTLPAVRESIEQKQWKLAEEQIVKVGKVLENAGEAIQGAAVELRTGHPLIRQRRPVLHAMAEIHPERWFSAICPGSSKLEVIDA